MNEVVKRIYVPENDIWGLPQTYLGLQFYPIKIRESNRKGLLYKVFAHPKNYIPDKEILKMSYLKFLLIVVQQSFDKKGSQVGQWITEFLKYATKEDDVNILYNYDTKHTSLDNISFYIMVGKTKISEYDFDNIREIVLEQNGIGIDYIEAYNKELEEKLDFQRKQGASFLEEVFSFCALANKTIDDVGEYTIFQFQQHIKRLILLEDYRLYRPLEASGMIKFKGTVVQHYLSSTKKLGRYDSILIAKDDFQKDSDVFKVASNK